MEFGVWVLRVSGFRILGFRVKGLLEAFLEFAVGLWGYGMFWGFGCGLRVFGFAVLGSGLEFWVFGSGLGFRVWGSGLGA